MGLLMSILVGCVGVIEIFACIRHVSHGLNPPLGSEAPCLSYHDENSEKYSSPNSLCSYSHSRGSGLPRGVRHKLENLHEYSLKVKRELRTLDKHFDEHTLSDCGTSEILGYSGPGSSLDFDEYEPADDPWNSNFESRCEFVGNRHEVGSINYQRIPTPVHFAAAKDDAGRNSGSASSSSSEEKNSFDDDSGNEAPTRRSFDNLSAASHSGVYSLGGFGASRSSDSPLKTADDDEGVFDGVRDSEKSFESLEILGDRSSLEGNSRRPIGILEESNGARRKKGETTIRRKPTNKPAENLNPEDSEGFGEPKRRKSDVSVQTIDLESLRDEATNTSPRQSDSSRSRNSRNVSVQVQTSFEDQLPDDEDLDEYDGIASGLSESKRDIFRKRSAFRQRRFKGSRGGEESRKEIREVGATCEKTSSLQSPIRSSRFEDAHKGDYEKAKNALLESERKKSPEPRSGKVKTQSEILDALIDEEFRDFEAPNPVEYSVPDIETNKAFWLIFSGEFTRAMNKDWHSGHFCCWQCDESLTGQRYVLRDEHPYCIKCYESVFANGCEECSKIIGIDSKDLSYKDKHWHEACFLCNKCRVSLVDKQFGSKVDKIYCGNCYDAQFASRCDGCGEIFRAGTKKMEYKTRQWHEKCFCCVVCKNPIGTKSFIPREQEIYCAGCYEDKFATRCVKCNKIITSGGVTYKNEPWHRECFTCSNCSTSLAGQRFTSRDEKPYCAECFGELFAKRCTACTKPITGIGGTRFISFEDRHWHNDCFICAGCKTSLVGHGFITDGDDIICPECAKQKLM